MKTSWQLLHSNVCSTMAGSFSGGGCVSDAPPFARLAFYMEKCGRFFWKMRKAWWMSAGHCVFLSPSCQKTPQGGLIAGMLRGRNGEFGVGDICDLRFCGRSSGLLVVGSRKRGPLAAFSDNSERCLCSEAPSWRFLTVVASLLSAFSALPSAGRQRCAFWMPCSRAPRPGCLALALERRRAFERRRVRACCANSAAELIGGLLTARWPGC